MEQQAIRIETLGDLVAHRYGMNAMCEISAMIAKFGADFRYVGHRIDRQLKCTRCGAREVHCQIHYLRSGLSPLAD
jgi:hypothetical protein